MNAPEAPEQRPFRPLLVAGVIFLLLLLLVGSLKSYRDLRFARQRVDDLNEQIGETELRIDELQEKIERLKTDPLTLERLAREDLGLVRPGDVVILLPPEPEETPKENEAENEAENPAETAKDEAPDKEGESTAEEAPSP